MAAPTYRPKCRTCDRTRKPTQLMCRRCWQLVPTAVQDAIYRTWKPGSIRQTDEWQAAVDRATTSVETALKAAGQ